MTTNKELLASRVAETPRGLGTQTTVFADKARNAEIWDVEGRRYIDLAAGIAVTNTGHNHPKVVAAVEAQLKRFSHTCFQVTPYDVYVALAARLNKLAPGPTPKKTIFLTTGVEAVENAIKISRRFTGRSAVIAFSGAFHGRTMMGMALTGKWCRTRSVSDRSRPRCFTFRIRSIITVSPWRTRWRHSTSCSSRTSNRRASPP